MARLRLLSPALGTSALVVALASSLILNVRLAIQLRSPHHADRIAGIKVGTDLSALTAIDTRGDRLLVAKYDGKGKPILLYVFSPKCRWSARDYTNLKALTRQVVGSHRVVVLTTSADGLTSYLSTHPFSGQILRLLEPLPEGFDVTPQTAVLTNSGRVERVWVGALMGERQRDAERVLKISLPGPGSDQEAHP
jgi:hypothetical protein